jgi:hypothetical protein
MKLSYIGKTTFNINGTIIHPTLAIPLNKMFNELKALNDEKHDMLIKEYDQLQLVMIDEISLVGNKMLTYIDHRLRVIKQIHNQFMVGFDIILTRDLYQAPLVQDSWIFKFKTNSLNILGTNLLHEKLKCHELKQIMKQNDINFINILNRFQTTSKTFENINFINKFVLKHHLWTTPYHRVYAL